MRKVVFFILGLFISVTAIAQTDNGNKVNEGDNLPVFEVDNGTKKISSNDLKGKVVLINFFATWCGPCLAELPVLQEKIYERFKNHPNFELLVIGREHSNTELATFATSKNLTLPFYGDPNREIFGKFAANSIPRNILVDRTGKIVHMSIGYSDELFNYLLELVTKELDK